MREFFADLHIHIGAGESGEPVKITASRRLTFANIARAAADQKGLDMVGIVDAASPVVLRDIEKMLSSGEMEELEEGGFSYRKRLVVIPGAEFESREENGGQAHYLGYFPYLDSIREFSQIMREYITNINLSSQAAHLSGREMFQLIRATGGTMVPAHIFTPYKSLYGRSCTNYREIFSAEEWGEIPGVELGLSADTRMADSLSELREKSFLSNSDAHSLGKIAREYNRLRLEKADYSEFISALKREGGRAVTANYGLDPRLGKYHRSFCPDCEESFPDDLPVESCPRCGSRDIVLGVKDRLMLIADPGSTGSPDWRPPYLYQIPLADIPGIGPRTLNRLLAEFGSEMNILHRVEFEELREFVGERLAVRIEKARQGKAEIKPGGGGIYGKVMG